jgi:protocatechuate 3,4-dioxygenase beta subunit
MTAKASYPNPFGAASASPACALTCELIQGPCYDATSENRSDISDGLPGLPMRMQLRLLDESCKPIAGALVEVWHASPVGKYSGNDAAHEAIAFCTENDPDFTSHEYFRGKQTSNENGVVTFDSCFPGWYHGRAIHVHAMVTVNGHAFLTTQLCFDDALNEDICTTQTIYASRGKIETTDRNDRTFPTRDLANYTFETAKMTDGALLASKTLVLRSSLDEKLCSYGGFGGPPPHGYPPPGGSGGSHGSGPGMPQHPNGPPPNGNQGPSGLP